MKRSPIKFPRRVRIHGGEFDASARAMHRSVRLAVPATIENVSVVTIERKQMSTKTTIKRIALVAVAAMGFGLLSVVPSQARSQADSLTLSATTASIVAGDTITASSPSVTLAFLADSNASDSMTVTAYLLSSPATNTAIPLLYVSDTTSAVVAASGTGSALAKGESITTQIAYVKSTTSAPAAVSAKFNIGLSKDGGLTGTLVTGDYKVRVVAAVSGSGGGTAVSTAQDVTITVKANPVTDTVATSATVVIGGLALPDSITSTTDEVVTASKTLKAANDSPSAVISVALKNANGSPVSAESYTAYITSGPGTLFSGAASGRITGGNTTVGRGRLISVKNGDGVGIYPDGTSGVTTVQILAASGAVLATKTMTFVGSVDKIVATAAKTVIGQRAETAVVSFRAYDAAGVEIKSGLTANLVSATVATVSNSYTACGTTYSTTTYWTCSATGVAAGTTSLTVTTNASATDTTGKTSNAVSVRVSASGSTTVPSDVIVSFDKATYAPGELATITITPVDSAGLIYAADTYTVFSVAMSSDYAFGAGSDSFSSLLAAHDRGVAGTGTVSGSATLKEYMPLSEGTVTVKYTTAAAVGSTAGLVARSISAVVSSASGSAAIEAANAAQASADAATDAANAAAESADAATAAAQDAAQAVADLATQVADLIASLKAQLTALTALVVKIQKKVKA